jgi:hypothetical protein
MVFASARVVVHVYVRYSADAAEAAPVVSTAHADATATATAKRNFLIPHFLCEPAVLDSPPRRQDASGGGDSRRGTHGRDALVFRRRQLRLTSPQSAGVRDPRRWDPRGGGVASRAGSHLLSLARRRDRERDCVSELYGD